jgi:hypothetical protein
MWYTGIVEIASSILAMVLVAAGLIGQGFELKKIRASIRTDEQLNPQNIFVDKRNFKWYALIAAGLVISFVRF